MGISIFEYVKKTAWGMSLVQTEEIKEWKTWHFDYIYNAVWKTDKPALTWCISK